MVHWPSAAEWVAAGQTKAAKPPQGRADLRAPQHSGGRPRRSLAGRGPKKKINQDKKSPYLLIGARIILRCSAV